MRAALRLLTPLAILVLGQEVLTDVEISHRLNETVSSAEAPSAIATVRELIFKRHVLPMRHPLADGGDSQGASGTPPPAPREGFKEGLAVIAALLLLVCFGVGCSQLDEQCIPENGWASQRAKQHIARKSSERAFGLEVGSELKRYQQVPRDLEQGCLPACCGGAPPSASRGVRVHLASPRNLVTAMPRTPGSAERFGGMGAGQLPSHLADPRRCAARM